MEQYIINVIERALVNGVWQKEMAEKGEAKPCYNLGLIYLLGIDTTINFEKASQYLSTPSLSDNSEAHSLLGFIYECEGDFSQAFQYYAKVGGEENDSYIVNVIKGRDYTIEFLKKLGLPQTFNKEISLILKDYKRNKASKLIASIKIAALCNDEQSCLEAANNLYNAKEYISAFQWLKKGNVRSDNPIYKNISENMEKSVSEMLSSRAMMVVDLENNSIFNNDYSADLLSKVNEACDAASTYCMKEWRNKNNTTIGNYINEYKDQRQKEALESQEREEERIRKRKVTIFSIITILSVILIIFIISNGSNSQGSKEKQRDTKYIEVVDTASVEAAVETSVDEPIDSTGQYEMQEGIDYVDTYNTDEENKYGDKRGYLHYWGEDYAVNHVYVGSFSDSSGSYPIELTFSSFGDEISDIVYKNVQVGVKIKMQCTYFTIDDQMYLVGKDGENHFSIHLYVRDANHMSGVANVGTYSYKVSLTAQCSH